jgi:hypothetical protein
MKEYSFQDTLVFRVKQIENAVSTKQAQFFYYKKFKNLLYWNPDVSEADIKSFKEAEEAIKLRIFGEDTKKPSKKVEYKKPTVSKKAVSEPTKGRNGRSNNQAKLDAMLTNLENSAELILASVNIGKSMKF